MDAVLAGLSPWHPALMFRRSCPTDARTWAVLIVIGLGATNLGLGMLRAAEFASAAAGALYPVFGLLLSPMIAAPAMSLSSVSVIGSALRLRALKL